MARDQASPSTPPVTRHAAWDRCHVRVRFGCRARRRSAVPEHQRRSPWNRGVLLALLRRSSPDEARIATSATPVAGACTGRRQNNAPTKAPLNKPLIALRT